MFLNGKWQMNNLFWCPKKLDHYSLPLSIGPKNLVRNRHKLIYAMTMKDMKTSILHAFHVLHGLKIKLASSPGAVVFGHPKEIRQLYPA